MHPNSLANLKRAKPFLKGHKPHPKAGRPRMKAVGEAVQDDYQRRGQAAIDALFNERLDLYFAYGFGKPIEQVVIDQTVKAEVQTQEVIDRAAAIRAEMEKQGQTSDKKP